MSTKEQYWKYSLIAIIIGLGIILFRQIAPFMGGLLGALTIYILVRKQMMYLSDKRKMKRSIAATLITAEAILCFLVPLGLVVWVAVVNLQNINLDPQAIIAPFEEAANIIKAKTGYYILGKDTVEPATFPDTISIGLFIAPKLKFFLSTCTMELETSFLLNEP